MSLKDLPAILATAACLGLPPVVAWSQPVDPRPAAKNKVYDYTVGGVRFRVPGAYMQPSPSGRKPDQELHFGFWVFDGEPVWAGVERLPEKDRTGRALYWPDEPGRPAFGGEDFVVRVRAVAPMTLEEGAQRQARLRETAAAQGRYPLKIEYGLQCYVRPNGSKGCVTSAGDDPDVNMAFYGDPASFNPAWRLYLYSRADRLGAMLDFPWVGQALWPDAVCRTLALVRAWRVSGGPSPDDCSKPWQPRRH